MCLNNNASMENGSLCVSAFFSDRDTLVFLSYFPELLFELFEPMLTSHSIQYANGTDWEERRKFLYPTLRDEFLKEYIPTFIQVMILYIALSHLFSVCTGICINRASSAWGIGPVELRITVRSFEQ